MLEHLLKKSTVSNIIISFIFVILGALLISKPEAMQSAIAIILGIFAIAVGVIKLINYASEEIKDGVTLSKGVILIIGGCILMFFGDTLQNLFRLVISAWIIYSAVMDLSVILKWNKIKDSSWYIALVISLFLLVAGIWILFNTTALIKTVGIVIVVYGILDIVENMIFMISLDKELK